MEMAATASEEHKSPFINKIALMLSLKCSAGCPDPGMNFYMYPISLTPYDIAEKAEKVTIVPRTPNNMM